MLADLYFAEILLSFFHSLISELAEWNSTKIGHMLGSNCNLKTHVLNLKYRLPLQIGGPNATFMGTICSLTANLIACIFGTKHSIGNQSSALTTTRGLLHHPEMSLTFVHKWLQTRPILNKFCFLRHCQALQTAICKQNSTTLCQTVDGKSHQQSVVEQVGSSSRKKWASRNFYICSVF